MRRSELALAALAFTVSVASGALAGPRERFESGYKDCSSKFDGTSSFTCSICGVTAGCDGNSCFWGALKTSNVTSSGELDRLFQGYTLYCLNQGGTLVTAAGPTATQSRSLDTAFRALRSGATRADVGGIVEYTRYDGGDGSAYGLAVPVRWELGSGSLAATLLAGSAPNGFKQIGVTGRYAIQPLTPSESGATQFLAVGVPFQFSRLSGDGLDASFGYAGGVSALYGAANTNRTAGVGVALDAIYARGFQAPVQIAGRYAFGPAAKLAIQPAVSTELLDPIEGLQESVLLGVELGDGGVLESLGLARGVLGAQLFYRSGNVTATLGLSGTPRALAGVRKISPGAEPAGPRPVGGACSLHADCEGTSVCIGGTCVAPKPYEPPVQKLGIVVVAASPETASWVRGIAERALEGLPYEAVRPDDVDAAVPPTAAKGGLDDEGARAVARRTQARIVQVRVEEGDDGALRVTVSVWTGEAFVAHVVPGGRDTMGTELRATLRTVLRER